MQRDVTGGIPSELEAARIVEAARRTFQRTLAQWAGDVLELRRRGDLGAHWRADADQGWWRNAA